MAVEEWAQFVSKGGIKTLSKKLDPTLRLTSDVEVDYLRVLTRLLYRYYQSNEPEVESSIQKIKFVNSLFDALYKLCLTLKEKYEDKSKKVSAPEDEARA